MLTTQLQALDDIFVTHFGKLSRYFMTSSRSWTEVMPLYENALNKYSNGMAQQATGPPMLKKIQDCLPEKMKWVMMGHGDLRDVPVFPLMTKSVVAMVTDSLQEIELALYEVSPVSTPSVL